MTKSTSSRLHFERETGDADRYCENEAKPVSVPCFALFWEIRDKSYESHSLRLIGVSSGFSMSRS